MSAALYIARLCRCKDHIPRPNGKTKTIYCDKPIKGSKIRITLNKNDWLTIGEVELLTEEGIAKVASMWDPSKDVDMYTGKHHFRRCLVTDGYTISIAANPDFAVVHPMYHTRRRSSMV